MEQRLLLGYHTNSGPAIKYQKRPIGAIAGNSVQKPGFFYKLYCWDEYCWFFLPLGVGFISNLLTSEFFISLLRASA